MTHTKSLINPRWIHKPFPTLGLPVKYASPIGKMGFSLNCPSSAFKLI